MNFTHSIRERSPRQETQLWPLGGNRIYLDLLRFRSFGQSVVDRVDVGLAGRGQRSDQVVVEDVPDCSDPIANPDFLSFFVGSAVVRNRDLIGSGVGFADHGRDLDLESKTSAGKIQRHDHFASESLVACLDIRHVSVGQQIAEQR